MSSRDNPRHSMTPMPVHRLSFSATSPVRHDIALRQPFEAAIHFDNNKIKSEGPARPPECLVRFLSVDDAAGYARDKEILELRGRVAESAGDRER